MTLANLPLLFALFIFWFHYLLSDKWNVLLLLLLLLLLLNYTTNRQVAGSIPDDVIGIFQWHNPSGRTMALGSTQPLTEMSTRFISWGKGGLCVRLTNLPPSCAVVMKSGNLNFLEPSGPLQVCNRTALPYYYYCWFCQCCCCCCLLLLLLSSSLSCPFRYY